MHLLKKLGLFLAALALSAGASLAQTEATEATEATAEEALLSGAELDTLMAPVALYPDTLLIQILVASTYPLDVVKGDRFVQASALEGEALAEAIDAEGWDASVGVLAKAFPDVLGKMAEHVDWTEAVGTAMMAQTEDVQASIQRLRDQAIQTGALVSTDEQTVETVDDEVVITPADPEVVYVPQYDANTVYDSSVGDALLTGALIFGGAILIDEIFDDDDDWNDYWGCRNCGGWGGGPIIRDPDIDIDIDGDVNIGNGNRPDFGWEPDDDRAQEARDKIAEKRGKEGATTLPIDRGPNRGDDLRKELSEKAGVKDITQREGASAEQLRSAAGAAGAGAAAGALAGKAAGKAQGKAPGDIKARTGEGAVSRPKAAVQKPAQIKKPAQVKKPSGGAIKPKAGGASKAKVAKARGAKSAGKRRR